MSQDTPVLNVNDLLPKATMINPLTVIKFFTNHGATIQKIVAAYEEIDKLDPTFGSDLAALVQELTKK